MITDHIGASAGPAGRTATTPSPAIDAYRDLAHTVSCKTNLRARER